MHDHLVFLIARIATREFAQAIFGPDFQSLTQWRSYWGARSNMATSVFRRPPALWTAAEFQTLYVACWLHAPVEKGSYMIPLTDPNRRQNVRAAMGNLATRWSSHLSTDGARSAGQGYQFLNGYSELLVQYEEIGGAPQLFLKTEGHPAASIAHLLSWVNKIRTGAGNTASDALHQAAAAGHGGLRLRAAENYDKPYEALLSYLNLKGHMHTVEEALPVILAKLRSKVPRLTGADVADEVERAQLVGAPLEKRLLARLIRETIIPSTSQPDVVIGRFVTVLMKATEALLAIADGLESDASDATTASVPRMFQEVRVTFEQLDGTVGAFLQGVTDWEL